MLMATPTPVLVAHADSLVGVGIATTLACDARLDVQEQVVKELDAAALWRRGRECGQVLVTDLLTGIETARALRRARIGRESASTAILVVSHLEGELNIRAALEAGVLGYLTYESRPAQLVDAVLAVAGGQRYLAGCIASRLAEAVAQDLPTRREAEVLKLMSAGLCNKAIAAELDIAAGTVKAHVKALLQKLDAPTRTAAADVAKRRGLVDPTGEQLALAAIRSRPRSQMAA
ncbi:response regulator transcription factor [Paucibacter sp. R3-3]|uniref:Response regulator transcription factor n=1 Tax=Roseateles agri TaxID=3098619 RepID=A0ABU5DJ90_9BURK|nr:response regulator transcription factor [Paucibacter sp. R3-3]MDY0746350.1 response regulator transcription factor [Paucibacter sp. R3-3]